MYGRELAAIEALSDLYARCLCFCASKCREEMFERRQKVREVWGFITDIMQYFAEIWHFSNASIDQEISSIMLHPSVTQSTEPWKRPSHRRHIAQLPGFPLNMARSGHIHLAVGLALVDSEQGFLQDLLVP